MQPQKNGRCIQRSGFSGRLHHLHPQMLNPLIRILVALYLCATNWRSIARILLATIVIEKLTRSEIIDESQIPKDKAYLGATVTLKDEKTGNEVTYMLVSTDEADFSENKISTESPVGKAMLGKKVGEKVEATVPAGSLKYEVIAIDR